jgi:hypothetical protein
MTTAPSQPPRRGRSTRGNVDLDVSLTQMNERGIDLQAQRFDGFDLTGDGVATSPTAIWRAVRDVIGASAGLAEVMGFTLGAGIERLGSYERRRRSPTAVGDGLPACSLPPDHIAHRTASPASEIPK